MSSLKISLTVTILRLHCYGFVSLLLMFTAVVTDIDVTAVVIDIDVDVTVINKATIK